MKKKLLLSLLISLALGNVFGQLPVGTTPQNKTVYLEEFTGIHCGYCPDGHSIGTQIYNADPAHVVLVNIHSGSFANASAGEPDFKTTWGTAIDGMSGMGITGYPAGDINRHLFSGSAMAAGRNLWGTMANAIKAQPAYCNVACQGTLNPQTRVLTVDVQVYYTSNSPVSTNSLNVFLLEDKIHGPQSNYGNYNPTNYNADGTYNHNHVLRASLTSTFGITIPNTAVTTLFTTQLTYTVPATYGAAGKTTTPNFENFKLAAFVTQTDREVINAADGPVFMSKDAKAIGINIASPVCGANVSPDVIITNSGLSTINDLTITPSIDAVAKAPTVWNGTLTAGSTMTVTLSNISSTVSGGHKFSCVISGDFYTGNNTGKGVYYSVVDYQAAPVAEGFVFSAFPPVGWASINSDNGPSWSRVTTTGGYNLSTEAAKYDFFSNSVIGDKDEFYLPPVDLSGADVPQLTFDVAYAQRTFNSNDMLDVFVSDDCGSSWTNVYNSSGTALTSAQPIATSYAPTANEWKTEIVNLTGFDKANVIVKFVTTNDNGNNMYLDNVNLAQPNPTGINKVNASQVNVSLYPNPTNGITTVKVSAVKGGEAKLSVVNTLGQVVLEKQITLNEGANTIQIDAKDFASGIYNVSLDTQSGSVVKKLTVTK